MGIEDELRELAKRRQTSVEYFNIKEIICELYSRYHEYGGMQFAIAKVEEDVMAVSIGKSEIMMPIVADMETRIEALQRVGQDNSVFK